MLRRAMPRFEPFCGLRYAPDLDLAELICPPYDVVDAETRARLAARHEANAIHVELPAEDDADDPRENRYQKASRLLHAWQEEKLLRLDDEPSFYVMRMTLPGGASTRGVIGALGCEPPGGSVLPHEETIPKDKSDRLDLLRACRANLSPIWGLSKEPGLARLLETSGPPLASARDDAGVLHELWQVSDARALEAISNAVSTSPLVIADGHHRYETALSYQAEMRNQGRGAGGHDFVMAFVVELSPEELTVRAIHRTIHGVPRGVDLVETFGGFFETKRAPAGYLEDVNEVPSELVLATRKGAWLLTPREEALEEARSDLDASVVALAVSAIPDAITHHHHTPLEALAELEAGRADAAVLLRPVRVEQISAWAAERRRMPAKSTYFHPKPATGMVFRLLDA
jgi:uncharacterized protein (DUF1015 family)